MKTVIVKHVSPLGANEVKPLARELAAAFRDRVNQYKYELGLSTEEAVAKAEADCPLSRLFRIMDCAPEELTWADLQEILGKTGERAADRWEEVKQAALEELRSGHWAGGVLEGDDPRPYRLARFLAIRTELAEGWQPRNGVERQLIDVMAQAQASMFYWQEQLFAGASVGGVYEAVEPAAMVERFHKMYIRTLRALQDLRRYAPVVVVQNAEQVNVGNQQLNMNNSDARLQGDRRRTARRRRVLVRQIGGSGSEKACELPACP
jgi:hypothetical protein